MKEPGSGSRTRNGSKEKTRRSEAAQALTLGSPDHYRLVLSLAMQCSRMGAWERDLVAKRVWWSEELEEIFGLEKGTFGGTEEHFFGFIHEDDRPIAAAAVASAIAERRLLQFEFRFYHTDGTIRWMEARGRAVYAADGEPVSLYGFGIDITDRKAAADQSRFLADLSHALQQISDPVEIMAVTARMLGDHLNADRCAYAEVADESVFVITGDHARGVPSIVGRWPVAAFGTECTRLMLANEPFVVSDSHDDARIDPLDLPAYQDTAIRAVICVPLHKKDKFTAAMAVHQKTPRKWTPAEINLVLIVVGRCWESLERMRAQRSVRQSDERFRLALSSGAVTVYEQDSELRYMWVYPESLYSHQVIGMTDEELSPDPAGVKRTVLKKRVLETGRPLREEVSAVVNGREHWYDLLIEPRRDANGDVIGVGGTALDITERKQADQERRKLQDELAASEARFRGLLEQAPLSIQLFEPGGRHIRVNRAWEELWGASIEDIPDYNILEDPQLESKGIAGHIRRVFSGEAVELPAILYDPNETIPGASDNPEPKRWVSAVAYPLKGPDGQIQEVALIHQDITERRRAEDEMVFQKTLLEALTESVLDGILIVSPTGEMLHVNQQFIDLWRFPPEVVEQRSDAAALEWAAEQTIDPKGFAAGVQSIYEHPDQQNREEITMKDGRVYERFGAPVFNGETRLGWVWTFHDITQRKLANEALELARNELERRVASRTKELADANSMLLQEMEERSRAESERLQLLRRVFTIQEDERGRIARDIHDHLGQRVTALRLKIAAIRDLCPENNEIGQRVDRLQEIAQLLDNETSFIAWELRPSILDDLDFVEALENFVDEWSRHSGITAAFHTSRLADVPIDQDVEINLYRIAQEALNNVAKHSKAKNVNVLLKRRSNDLTLIIEDDGVGISTKKSDAPINARSGFGLVGMRERASLIGGSIEVESKKGKGTTIFVLVPLTQSPKRRSPVLKAPAG